MIKTLFIDLDDTLIPSGHTYFLPQLHCCKIITMELGPDIPHPAEMMTQQDNMRKAMMAVEGPVSPHVFPQSWILLYKEYCGILGREVNPHIVTALGLEGSSWLQKEYALYAGVADTLAQIEQQKIIVTLGDLDIQTFKTQVSGAHKLVDYVEVVDLKVTKTYEDLLEKYNLKADETIMVGDNAKLDIQPALTCGMRAFHILGKFDRPMVTGLHPKYTALSNFNEILKYLPNKAV